MTDSGNSNGHTVQKLQTLIEALKALVSRLAFEDSYRRFLTILKKDLGFTRVGLLGFESRSSRFQPLAELPSDYNHKEFDRLFARVSRSIARFLEQSEDDVPVNYVLRFNEKRVNYSLFLLPLRLHEQLTGMLVLSKPYSDDDAYIEDQDFLSALAGQVAVFLERARLSRRIEADRQRMEFLYKVARETSNHLVVPEIHKVASRLILKEFPLSACVFLTMDDEDNFRFFLRSRTPLSNAQERTILRDLKENLIVYLDTPHQEALKKLKRENVAEQFTGRRRPDLSATWSCLLAFNDRLTGIFAVYGARGEAGLEQHDTQKVLSTAAMQVAAAIENAILFSRTKRLSITDPVTSLYNHRHFLQVLDQEQHRFERYGTRFSLIMVDIDHFKGFNDQYGHKTGDEVLFRVAEILKNGGREIDTVCRYGGEEFVIIMPETGLPGARRMAERLRKTIEKKRFRIGGQNLKITASFGVAEAVTGTRRSIVERSDEAMYAAKHAGRNTVFYLEENPPPLKSVTLERPKRND